MSVICPLCQTIIAITSGMPCPECNKVRTLFNKSARSTNYYPEFSCHAINDKVNYYQTNILIDGKLYGFDSYVPNGPHTDILLCDDFGVMQLLFKLQCFTPIPKSKEEIEHTIRRILNLKAFL
jgi:hypothetical protein